MTTCALGEGVSWLPLAVAAVAAFVGPSVAPKRDIEVIERSLALCSDVRAAEARAAELGLLVITTFAASPCCLDQKQVSQKSLSGTTQCLLLPGDIVHSLVLCVFDDPLKLVKAFLKLNNLLCLFGLQQL